MLNKKGTSLMELIISIALISVVLVFIMRLLVDLNNMETNNDYAKNNQLIRAEILRAIENDLNTKTIIDIDDNGSSRSNLVVNFTFKEGSTSSISATENTLEYTNSNGELRRWTLEEGHIFTESAKVYFSPEVIGDGDLTNRIYTMLIDIEIHTTNDKNTVGDNNPLDDILLNYIGKQLDYNKNITCLGDACNNTYPDTKTLAQYIKDLYTTQGSNNLYHHDGTLENGINDGSYRYAGSYETTNNWVCFGTDSIVCDDEHLYRIIGVFNNRVKLIKAYEGTETSLGTAPNENDEKDTTYYKGKLDSIPSYYWSKNDESNNWLTSTLNINILNGTYLTTLGTKWNSKIVMAEWTIGGNVEVNIGSKIVALAYQNEVVNPSTNIVPNPKYNAKVGLMYANDYGFASSPINWTTDLYSYSNDTNRNNNWLFMGTSEWTLSPFADNLYRVFIVSYVGSLSNGNVGYTFVSRPTFYLNSNVTYVSGTGTPTNPIRIN